MRTIVESLSWPKKWLLFSGWAMDSRVFNFWNLPISQPHFIPYLGTSTVHRIVEDMQTQGSEPLGVLGFSMGGFLASEVAAALPQVTHQILIGVRPQYDTSALREVSLQLYKGQSAWLRSFYRECFSPCLYAQFQKELWPDYHIQPIEILQEGLTHLSTLSLSIAQLSATPYTYIIHGRQDRIAPIEEMRNFLNQTPFTLTELDGYHFPDYHLFAW